MKALLAVVLACAGASAQDMTAEQVIEKGIQASGGREAMQKITSRTARGTVDVTFAGITAPTEVYAKAPNKMVSITTVEGYGIIKNGFDGTVGWSDTPEAGIQEFKGDRNEESKRNASFNGLLKWRELYDKAELKGKEKVGERDTYVVVLAPKAGKPVMQYYDASTFELVRQVQTTISDQGEAEVKSDFSDYREIDGVKAPFTIRQTIPMGELIIKLTEVKHNVEIEDAKFAKPSAQ
jgi:outer membrane lipoprotein-sorting protein